MTSNATTERTSRTGIHGELKSILVVDDNPSVLDMVAKGLRRMGHVNVATACNGQEAIQAAALKHPDVVIVDIEMPGMDGIETAQQLASLYSCVIIFSTGLCDNNTLSRCREVSASSYLVKPYSLAQLQAAVQIAA